MEEILRLEEMFDVGVLEFLEKFSPWSFSKISLLLTCPQMFYKNRVEKKSYYETAMDLNTLKGTIVHRFMYYVFTKKCKINELGLFLRDQKAPEHTKDLIFNQYDSIKSVYENIVKLIRDAKSTDIPEHPKIVLRPEYTLKTHWIRPTIKFTAVVDLLIETWSENYIIDHKSNDEYSDHFNQLLLYTILFQQSSQDTKIMKTYTSSFKTGKLTHRYTFGNNNISTDLHHAQIIFINSINAIVSPIVQSGIYHKIPKGHCQWCHLKESCV
jgi:hypothetical protein